MALYWTPDDYADVGYVQTGLDMNWITKVITVPQFFLTPLGGGSYSLDTNAFRIALRELEDSEDGVVNDPTHNHNTAVTLDGIQYARIIEILSPYTITFEETGTPYKVFLTGSNNNILSKTNLGTVQVAPNNSAGLINLVEVQQGAFEGQVSIDGVLGTDGTLYPIGTLTKPVKTITDAKIIASSRGIDEYFIVGNLTIGSTDDVRDLRFEGQGATMNTAKTTVTLTSGCVTSNSHWKHCKITGYQGGESFYEDCVIDGLDNAHCFYVRCALLDGTVRGYTIRQTSSVSSGHASYFKECYSDEGTAILDRNGARLNVTFDGFHGRLKIINQNHATSSGQVWIHLNGGVITVDSTCTKGKITVTGTGTLVNLSSGTEVDASGFTPEGFEQSKLNIESLRQTHQGFGTRWFVDPVSGDDLSPGNSSASPLRTVVAAINKAVSGRGDVIYLMAPAAGTATINERIVINKEDIHLRGPGRGIQFQPTSTDPSTPIINVTANNCSFGGFIVRSNTGETSGDSVVISGKFSRWEKVYMVGPGQTGNACRGMVFTGGDYHELHDMEIEKYGDDGLVTDDKSDTHANGSPREITIFGGNIYLNGSRGISLEGKVGSALGSTTRIIRLLRGANIHDNLSVGVYSDANTQGVVIDDTVLIHSNNGGNTNIQAELNGTGYFKQEYNAKLVWEVQASSVNATGSTGAKLNTASSGGVDYQALADAVRTELTPELAHVMTLENNPGLTSGQATMLLELYQLAGLDPLKPLIVTQNIRQIGDGTGILQNIATNTNQTVVTRV